MTGKIRRILRHTAIFSRAEIPELGPTNDYHTRLLRVLYDIVYLITDAVPSAASIIKLLHANIAVNTTSTMIH